MKCYIQPWNAYHYQPKSQTTVNKAENIRKQDWTGRISQKILLLKSDIKDPEFHSGSKTLSVLHWFAITKSARLIRSYFKKGILVVL